jgi:hypothetical protein
MQKIESLGCEDRRPLPVAVRRSPFAVRRSPFAGDACPNLVGEMAGADDPDERLWLGGTRLMTFLAFSALRGHRQGHIGSQSAIRVS